MDNETNHKHSKWPMRLAVISTIATVLAVFTPFMIPLFTSDTEEETNNASIDLPKKEQIEADTNELLDDIELPKLPEPGTPGSVPPLGPPPFRK